MKFNALGEFGQANAECDHWTKKCTANDVTDPSAANKKACWGTRDYVCNKGAGTSAPKVGTSAPVAASSGVSAGEVLTGIGAILAPLAQAGVGIYAAQQQAKLAEMQYKYQANQPTYAPPAYFPPQQKSSPVLFIVLAVVGLMVVGGMFYMMQSGGSVQGTASAVSVGAPVQAASAAPRITKVRRVRKSRRPRSKK